jgi:hypothetical protein
MIDKFPPMTDEEFCNWKKVVKCNWLRCAGGEGLAGNGCCCFQGDFTNPDCPKFITDDDYENKMLDKDDRV